MEIRARCRSIEEAKQLFGASDMFQLDGLKALCQDAIGALLSNETVVSVLLFSHQYQAKGLKDTAMDFMLLNWQDPVVSQHRSELLADPTLMQEVLNHKNILSKTAREL